MKRNMQKRNMQKNNKIYSGGSSRVEAAVEGAGAPTPLPAAAASPTTALADKMTALLQKLRNDDMITKKFSAGENFFISKNGITDDVEGAIKEGEDEYFKKFTQATNAAITEEDVKQATNYINDKKDMSLEKVKLIHSKLSGLNILIDVTYDIVEIIIILLKGRQGTRRHTKIIKALIGAYNELNKHLNGIDEHINDKNEHLMDKFKDILGQLNDLNEKEKEKIIEGLGGVLGRDDLNKILIERVQGVLGKLQTKIDTEEFFTAGFKLTDADKQKLKDFWNKIIKILNGDTAEEEGGGDDGAPRGETRGGRKRKARKTKKRQHRGGYQYTKSRRSTRKVTSRSKGNRSKGSRSGRRSISKRTTRKSINKRGGRTTRRR